MVYATAALVVLSCMKDGEVITASVDGNAQVSVSSVEKEVVLGLDNNSSLVLTLYWEELGQVNLSNPEAGIPDGMLSYALQLSPVADFSQVHEHEVGAGALSAQFTGRELNSILSRLGYAGGTAAPLYIRMKMALGTNTEPLFGEAMSIMVTPYTLDMSSVKLVDKADGVTVSAKVPATAESGEYAGFVYIASSWYNFYFEEGDGTRWGNDGVSGTPFVISDDSSTFWNCWFPEPAGFYFVTMSTGSLRWTALHIPAIQATAEGNVTEMTYSAGQNRWSCSLTTSSENAAIDLGCSGAYYDFTTGDGSPATKTLSFQGGDNGRFVMTEGVQSSGIKASAAGTYTISLDFSTLSWELTRQ